jgi:hypothetical protein
MLSILAAAAWEVGIGLCGACKHRNCKVAFGVNAMAPAQVQLSDGRQADATGGVSMSEPTMQPDVHRPGLESSRLPPSDSVQPPRPEDEGLSVREIKWIPLVVPSRTAPTARHCLASWSSGFPRHRASSRSGRDSQSTRVTGHACTSAHVDSGFTAVRRL